MVIPMVQSDLVTYRGGTIVILFLQATILVDPTLSPFCIYQQKPKSDNRPHLEQRTRPRKSRPNWILPERDVWAKFLAKFA